jgi:hypothetical protein
MRIVILYRSPAVFKGADYGVTAFLDEVSLQAKLFFEEYLRDGKKWPSLEKH